MEKQKPSNITFTVCIHLMDKREEQGGDRDEHKLHAGAGKGDDKLAGVVDIAFIGDEMKGDAA